MPRSPSYSPPTLSEFRTSLLRSLRDPDGSVFGYTTLNEVIAEGLMSMDGYRPMEAMETQGFNPGMFTNGMPYLIPATLSSVWQVLVNNETDSGVSQAQFIPYSGPDQQSVQVGWDFYDGTLILGRWMTAYLSAWSAHYEGEPFLRPEQNPLIYEGVVQGGEYPLHVVMYGYRDRNVPVDSEEFLDLGDNVDQLCLIRECKATGFQLLNNDRALYQQWLAATNNTDVSPTQLQGMLSGAVGDVERQRKRSAILRRTPIVGPQYI